MKRQLFIATSISAALAGCAPIGTALNDNAGVRKVLASVEGIDDAFIGSSGALAREYRESDVAPVFRVNGFATPSDANYRGLLASYYAKYRLVVDGAVERPYAFTLAQLRALPQSTQITRHDCVEGWSVIGKWSGVRLGSVLDAVGPRSNAGCAIFHCMDRDDSGTPYYESLDLRQAYHPQALLATSLNDEPLDPDHGAPVRLRVPTQLGYKSAKWVNRIEVVENFAHIAGGNGGYWEDQGYEWYAGV